MIVLGIDPGIRGAMASYHPSLGWEVHVLPVALVKKGRKELVLAEFLKLCRRFAPGLAVIEKPPMIPGNGVFGTASLFKGFGQVTGVLAALGWQMEQPDPKVWKATILKGTTKDKLASINYVRNRYPAIDLIDPDSVDRKKDHDGKADAVCLAEYGRRILHGSTA